MDVSNVLGAHWWVQDFGSNLLFRGGCTQLSASPIHPSQPGQMAHTTCAAAMDIFKSFKLVTIFPSLPFPAFPIRCRPQLSQREGDTRAAPVPLQPSCRWCQAQLETTVVVALDVFASLWLLPGCQEKPGRPSSKKWHALLRQSLSPCRVQLELAGVAAEPSLIHPWGSQRRQWADGGQPEQWGKRGGKGGCAAKHGGERRGILMCFRSLKSQVTSPMMWSTERQVHPCHCTPLDLPLLEPDLHLGVGKNVTRTLFIFINTKGL